MQKKIRGHKKIHRQIESWRNAYLHPDLNLLNEYKRLYVKIMIHPFCDISVTNSKIPSPKGKTKILMLSALLDIYDSWKNKLDKTGQPYYLKLWLFEPRFSKSQVVCAMGDLVDFYNNTFTKSAKAEPLNTTQYGKLHARLKNYYWELHLDEDIYAKEEKGEPGLDEPSDNSDITKKSNESTGDMLDCFVILKGNVWLGSRQ